MDYTVNNFMVLIINSDKELVEKGIYVNKKFASTRKIAEEFMKEKAHSYKKAKKIQLEKTHAFIDCGEYFVQMQIIDCSKTIKILG